MTIRRVTSGGISCLSLQPFFVYSGYTHPGQPIPLYLEEPLENTDSLKLPLDAFPIEPALLRAAQRKAYRVGEAHDAFTITTNAPHRVFLKLPNLSEGRRLYLPTDEPIPGCLPKASQAIIDAAHPNLRDELGLTRFSRDSF